MTGHRTPSRLSPVLDDDTLAAIAEAVDHRRVNGASKAQHFMRSDVVKMLGQLLVAALLAYGVVNARISVVEDRVNTIKSDITEIRNDVKALLRRDQ